MLTIYSRPFRTASAGGRAIRYTHIIEHPNWQDTVEVGCVCCEALTADYIKPREREHSLGLLASRRLSFLKSPRWYQTSSANLKRVYKGIRVTVFKVETGLKAVVDGTFWRRVYPSALLAKATAFNFLNRQKSM